MVAGWLDLAGVLWCHVPNAGAHKVQYRAKLARLGLKSGVPDILIFSPPPAAAHRGARGCALELKRRRGGQVLDTQKFWLAELTRCGWATYVAAGADDAILWLSSVMGYRVGPAAGRGG